jgi:hypothetical protein
MNAVTSLFFISTHNKERRTGRKREGLMRKLSHLLVNGEPP